MKRKTGFLLLGIVIALIVIYRNQLFFFFQLNGLNKHIALRAPVYNSNRFPAKSNFCTIQPYSKVWAHRVNTLERFQFLLTHFQGFEMDIVFDGQQNFLDVRHPPATSIHLSFEKYLQVKGSSDKFFWLDFKNLNNGNEQPILRLLAKLDVMYDIRKRIIVESNDILSLGKISEAGFFTSYYYDNDSYKDFMNYGNDQFRDSVFSKIDAVSQDVLIYDTLLKKFPFKPRLTWALSIKNYWSGNLFNMLDKDNRLLVYLVNVKSPGYR